MLEGIDYLDAKFQIKILKYKKLLELYNFVLKKKESDLKCVLQTLKILALFKYWIG